MDGRRQTRLQRAAGSAVKQCRRTRYAYQLRPQFALLVKVRSAAFTNAATACGCDNMTAWLLLISTVCAPLRSAIMRCALGGIIWSFAVTMNEVGLTFHATLLIFVVTAWMPHGTCAIAMKRVIS